jgi:hypothetical protein
MDGQPPAKRPRVTAYGQQPGEMDLDVAADLTIQFAKYFATPPGPTTDAHVGVEATKLSNYNGTMPPGKRHRGKANPPTYLDLLSLPDRGDKPFVCVDGSSVGVLQGIALSSMSALFAAGAAVLAEIPFPRLPVHSVTHESLQLQFNRPGLPECAAGKALCAVRTLPGGMLAGALPACLTPDEELLYQSGHTDAITTQLNARKPAFCLICIRATLAATKFAAVELGAQRSTDGTTGLFAATYTNTVDAPDGYRASAMAVTPADKSIVGGAFVCTIERGLSIMYNKLTESFYVHQSSEIVFTEESNPHVNGNVPFL